MIVTELYMKRDNGDLYRTYSDEGFFIERDGERYEEAIDPVDLGRVYTETNERIPASGELTAEEILSIITGGEL